ncbi:MAG: hypothetical protein AAF936_17580 [Pseudomonadota bacterium]
MLTFMGLDWDSAPKRAAKLAALRKYFKTGEPHAFNMLTDTELSKANASRGASLVVNSHGNSSVFAGCDADTFFSMLKGKGFEEGAFTSIYLMACNISEQHQDNRPIDTFAKRLRRLFNEAQITCKIYAPRGKLSYCLRKEQKSGQAFWVVTKMYIKSPERNYPLDEGLLYIQ